MRAGVVVAGGSGDSAASAVGVGAIADGAAFLSLGTSGILLVANDSFRPMAESAVHTFCHAIPGAWHQIGVMLTAASALSWYATIAGATPTELAARLGDRLRPPGAVTFLPYLSGERTPHNSATIRGMFAGLSHDSDHVALTQAVLEGVAFALRDNLEALRRTGADPARLTAVGGGSRSRYWLQAIATALGLPVDMPHDGDLGAAFGAARLGMVAASGADPLEICTPPQIETTIEPETGLRAAFEDAYARFRGLGAAADRP
jgi:xylulokinase